MELFAWLIVPLLLAVAVPHELAHLLAARAFGVTVLEFGIGLPPRAASFRWRGITWSVSWLLPFGAFVRLKGEQEGDAPDDFSARPAWQRAVVVLAGPVANLLVAALAVAASLAFVGVPAGLQAEVRAVQANSPAALAGLQPGDRLLAVDDQRTSSGATAEQAWRLSSRASLLVARDGIRQTLVLPTSGSPADLGVALGTRMSYQPLGAARGDLAGDVESLLDASARSTASQGWLMVGWVGLAQIMSELADVGIPPLAWFLALLASLSLGLGLTNLLPIPPLDGSRVFLSALEGVSRRRIVSPRTMARLNVAGLVALVVVFLAVTGSDLVRLFHGGSVIGLQ